MYKMDLKKQSIVTMILGVFLAGSIYFGRDTNAVFEWYTNGYYKIANRILGDFSSHFTFSIGEQLVVFLAVVGIIILARRLYDYCRYSRRMQLKEIVVFFLSDAMTVANVLLLMVVIFQALWGMNYHRPSLYQQLGLNEQGVDAQLLMSLMEDLATDMAEAREVLKKNDAGVVIAEDSIADVLNKSYHIYCEASDQYEFIEYPTSPPKLLFYTNFFSYNGISGIYNPYTGEANVNPINSQFMLPAVTLHELSHQQGVAREDEANFIAFFLANQSEDVFTRYSGQMLLLIYGMNNLKRIDSQMHTVLYEGLDEGIKRDLIAHSALWRQYEGPIETTHRSVNDAYLKANGQSGGIETYSEMVGLYVAWILK